MQDDPASGHSALAGEAVAARLKVTVIDESGQRPRVVTENSGHVALTRRTVDEVGARVVETGRAMAGGWPQGFSPITTDQGYFIPLGSLPEFGSTVLAVDPESERRLAGGSSAAAAFDTLASAPAARDPRRAADQWRHLVDSDTYAVSDAALSAAADGVDARSTIVPLVVSNQATAQLSMKVTIELRSVSARDVEAAMADSTGLTSDTRYKPWRSVQTDVSAATEPFASPDLVSLWPGSLADSVSGTSVFSTPTTKFAPVLIGRPSYVAQAHGSGPAFRVKPLGQVDAAGDTGAELDAASGSSFVPSFRAYRQGTATSGPGVGSCLALPLGSYAPSELTEGGEQSAGFVPTGVRAATAAVTGADGVSQLVTPSPTSLDFLTAAPGAFTDLAGGEALRGATPIDAIRVRVAGVDAYTTANQQRISELAARISELGLSTTIVAGSSQQPVDVYVPSYYSASAKGGEDLGWVSQEWTTLGAAVRAKEAMSGSTAALAWGVLGVVGLVSLALSLMAAQAGRRGVATLRIIGWSRGAVARRLAGRELPWMAVPVATSVACYLLGPRQVAPASLGLGLLALVSGVATVAIGLISARVRRRPSSRGAPISGWAAIASRRVVRRPLSVCLALGSAVAITAVAALSASVLSRALREAGATTLADLLRQRTAALAIALGVVGVLAALVILVIGRRMELRERVAGNLVLRSAGVGAPHRLKLAWLEEGLLVGAIVVLGGSVSAIAAVVLGRDAIAFAAGILATSALVVTRLITTIGSGKVGVE